MKKGNANMGETSSTFSPIKLLGQNNKWTKWISVIRESLLQLKITKERLIIFTSLSEHRHHHPSHHCHHFPSLLLRENMVKKHLMKIVTSFHYLCRTAAPQDRNIQRFSEIKFRHFNFVICVLKR